MSRIFDALQRSNLEGEGFEFPLVSSLATEVAQTAAEEEVETNDLSPATSSSSSPCRFRCRREPAGLPD